MIEIQQIDKTFFKGTEQAVHALKNFTLSIPAGEFLVLLGSNGSGKSTLLNCIGGSVIADSGKILVDGNNIAELPEYARSKWISRVFQNPLSGTAGDLSIIENFRLASIRTQSKTLRIGINSGFKSKIKEQVRQLNLGLEEKLDQPMGGLSGGQRQAITLLMAVTDTTKILLMDEPASALDPKTAELIMDLANKLIKEFKLTAILVTHNLKDAVKYGDRILLLKEGKISEDIDKRHSHSVTASSLLEYF